MNPRLILLIIALLTYPFLAGTLVLAQERDLARCQRHINAVLGFDGRAAARISPRNAITFGLIESITRLSFGRGPWSEGHCAPMSARIAPLLYHYVSRRFEYLLSHQEIETIYHEHQIARPFHLSGNAAIRFAEALPTDFNRRYLELLKVRLLSTLENSPWNDYRTLQFSVESWSDEWRLSLGANATSAVALDLARVAVDPFALPPNELEYFLFHELAHLKDWENERSSVSLRENERYAWEETLRFIAWRTAQGHDVPPSILRIREIILRIGLASWSSAALRTREIQLE